MTGVPQRDLGYCWYSLLIQKNAICTFNRDLYILKLIHILYTIVIYKVPEIEEEIILLKPIWFKIEFFSIREKENNSQTGVNGFHNFVHWWLACHIYGQKPSKKVQFWYTSGVHICWIFLSNFENGNGLNKNSTKRWSL